MTQFSVIYDMNSVIMNAPSFQNYDDFNLSKILYKYLKYAISYFMFDCAKDLQNRADPIFEEYIVVCDGVNRTFELPEPPVFFEKMVVAINDNEEQDFVYEPVSKILELTSAPAADSTLRVQISSDGYFNSDLDEREIHILSEAMVIPFLENFKNDENALRYIVSGKSIKFYSQASHLAATSNASINQVKNTVDALISDYTYKTNYGNFDKLVGR